MPELVPRAIWPALTTPGATNTGPGLGVGGTTGDGAAVALVGEALGEGAGDGTGSFCRKTAAERIKANARAPTSTAATTARNVLSLMTPTYALGESLVRVDLAGPRRPRTGEWIAA